DLGDEIRRVVLPDHPAGAAAAAGRQGVLLEDHDVRPGASGQVVGDGRPLDAAADDDHVRRARHAPPLRGIRRGYHALCYVKQGFRMWPSARVPRESAGAGWSYARAII